MKNVKVIGLAGNRGTGKDTFFTLMNERNSQFERYAFADALKRDLYNFIWDHFGFSVWQCTPEQKEIIRPILIAYGCAQRSVNIDHWANKVCEKIKEDFASEAEHLMEPFIPVITDVRFENEVEVLRKAFGDEFLLVNIERIGAPKPTDEEEKHYRKVAALADDRVIWGDDSPEEQSHFVEFFLSHPELGKSLYTEFESPGVSRKLYS